MEMNLLDAQQEIIFLYFIPYKNFLGKPKIFISVVEM